MGFDRKTIMFSRFASLAFGAVLLLAANVLGDNVYQDIASDILRDYDSRVSPVHSDVKISFDLRRIVEFDVNKGLLTLDAWFHMEWEDPRLSWSQSDFENTSSIVLPSDSVWIPDTTLYNSATGYIHYDNQVRALVKDTGLVFYIPPVQVKSYCNVGDDYDGSQNVTCTLKFGNWVYDGDHIDLNVYGSDGFDLSNFDDDHSAGWSLMGVSHVRNVVTYECCPEPYLDITYSIVLHADHDHADHDHADHDHADHSHDADH